MKRGKPNTGAGGTRRNGQKDGEWLAGHLVRQAASVIEARSQWHPQLGDTVKHASFGVGTVTDVGRGTITVRFAGRTLDVSPRVVTLVE